VDPNQILLTEITVSWWKDVLDCLSGYVEKGWISFVGSILNCMRSTRVKLEAVKSLFDAVSVQLRKAAYNLRKRRIDNVDDVPLCVTHNSVST
jgi:hypothetical protein